MSSMRDQMPNCAAWVDALRDAFGREFIDERIRTGLKDGTCWFAEAGHYIGQPGQPEHDAEREADEFRFTLDRIATGVCRKRKGAVMGAVLAWRKDDVFPAAKPINDPWAVSCDQQAVHDRLLNYGRWACDKMQTGHCSSVEWQYDAGGREVQPARVARAVVLDAEVVFGALRQLPERERIVLNLWYVNRRSPNRIAMRAGVSPRVLPALLRSARQMLMNRLRRVGG